MKRIFLLLCVHQIALCEPTLLDGKKLSLDIQAKLKYKVELLKEQNITPPHLAIIVVGHNPASKAYVRHKKRACEKIGYQFTLIQLENSISQKELCDQVTHLNNDNSIDGLIVQLPLPDHLDKEMAINAIDPKKDVDGMHPENMGKIKRNHQGFIPATPYGIIKLLKHYNIETKGKHCVVIGGSEIVGHPISVLLTREECPNKSENYPSKCTVTQCHQFTQNLAEYTRQADIIICAVGKPGLITKDMVKEHAVIIDVGITRIPTKNGKSKLVGDVDFDNTKEMCSFITPVPGGVGPMTVAALLRNTYKAAKKRIPHCQQ